MTQLCADTMGHLSRKRKSMRLSTDSRKKPQNHGPWFSWGADIRWKDNTARHTQSRNFLKSTNDNVLIQMTKKPTIRIVLLDLY